MANDEHDNRETDDEALVKYTEKRLGHMGIVPPSSLDAFEATTGDQPERIPYLKLIQAASDDAQNEGIKPGTFRNSLTGEVLDSQVLFVPIEVVHRRFYFVGRELSCFSLDSLRGEGEPGGICAKCPKNVWYIAQENGTLIERPHRGYRLKKHESWVHPECSDTYMFPSLILSGIHKAPAAVIFRSKALGEGLDLSRMMRDLPEEVYTLSAVLESNDKGKWFAPRKKLANRKMTNEEIERLNFYRGRFAEQMPEMEVEEPEPEEGD
jgi:hypothetical protein